LKSLDDPERAVGELAVGVARHKASGVCVAFSVESARSVLAPIVFYFEVVGDGFAFKPVTEDHFIVWVLKLKTTQHTEWYLRFLFFGEFLLRFSGDCLRFSFSPIRR
jgi:hypothetical protein